MICAWAAPPTRISRGLRAYQGVHAHIQRFACELHARPGAVERRGYRTKRVGFVVTFRLFGAEKTVLKLVGANLKDGQNVLVL